MTDNDSEELPTATEADFCKNCGLIETVIPIQNFTVGEKQPCEDNQMKKIELVRREDVLDLIDRRIEEHKQGEEKNPKPLSEYDRAVRKSLESLRSEIAGELEEESGGTE